MVVAELTEAMEATVAESHSTLLNSITSQLMIVLGGGSDDDSSEEGSCVQAETTDGTLNAKDAHSGDGVGERVAEVKDHIKQEPEEGSHAPAEDVDKSGLDQSEDGLPYVSQKKKKKTRAHIPTEGVAPCKITRYKNWVIGGALVVWVLCVCTII